MNLKRSYPETARLFGDRDHTTAMAAIGNIAAWLPTDATLRAHIEAIERELGCSEDPA